jgi:hypothetical protein
MRWAGRFAGKRKKLRSELCLQTLRERFLPKRFLKGQMLLVVPLREDGSLAAVELRRLW